MASGDAFLLGYGVAGTIPGQFARWFDALTAWTVECESRRDEAASSTGGAPSPPAPPAVSRYFPLAQNTDDNQLTRIAHRAARHVGSPAQWRGEGASAGGAKGGRGRLCLLFAAHKVIGCGLATTKAVMLLTYDKAGFGRWRGGPLASGARPVSVSSAARPTCSPCCVDKPPNSRSSRTETREVVPAPWPWPWPCERRCGPRRRCRTRAGFAAAVGRCRSTAPSRCASAGCALPASPDAHACRSWPACNREGLRGRPTAACACQRHGRLE